MAKLEKKIQKKFVDEGFGFPVILLDVPMVKIRGEWTLAIDYNRLTEIVLEALCFKPARLSGNETKFIRTHREMTLEQFSKRFGVSHPAVLKWEKKGNSATYMSWSTEKDIRLFVWEKLTEKPKKVGELYSELEEKPTASKHSIKVHGEEVAA